MRIIPYTVAAVLVLPWTMLSAAMPFLGVGTQSVPPWHQDADLFAEGVGLQVLELVPESAADKVLQPGDILEKLNQQWLINPEQLAALVKMKKPGDEIQLTFYRDGSRQTAKVTLGERPLQMPASSGPAPGMLPRGPMPGMGAMGMPAMPPHLQERLREMERQMEALQRQFHPSLPQGNAAVNSITSRSMSWMEGETRVEYHEENGEAEVVITEKGNERFRGPLNSAEEFQRVPKEFHEFLREKGLEPEEEGIQL